MNEHRRYGFNGTMSNSILKNSSKIPFNGEYERLFDDRIVGVIRNLGGENPKGIFNDALVGLIENKALNFLRILHPMRNLPAMFYKYNVSRIDEPNPNIENFGKYVVIGEDKSEFKKIADNLFIRHINEAYRIIELDSHFPVNLKNRLLTSQDLLLEVKMPPIEDALKEISKDKLVEIIEKINSQNLIQNPTILSFR